MSTFTECSLSASEGGGTGGGGSGSGGGGSASGAGSSKEVTGEHEIWQGFLHHLISLHPFI